MPRNLISVVDVNAAELGLIVTHRGVPLAYLGAVANNYMRLSVIGGGQGGFKKLVNRKSL